MDDVARIRRFNRTLTQRLGVLQNEFLGRKRSLGASRVLYEIGAYGTDIRALRERLELDSGYATRLVQGLENEGLVKRVRAEDDARVRKLTLTKAGKRELSALNTAADKQAKSVLAPLTRAQQSEFLHALMTVERYYTQSMLSLDIEDPDTRDAGFCLKSYYVELAERFSTGFEAKESISAKPEELRLPNGCFLVARLRNQPVGCGALKLQGNIAEIKRMWVSREQRGLGIGVLILEKLESIADERGISALRLETNETLKEAQSLYRKHGYREVPAFNDEPYAHHWFEKRIRRTTQTDAR